MRFLSDYVGFVRKASGTSWLTNRNKAAGIGVDTADSYQLKYNANSTVKTLADLTSVQTFTNKTFSGATQSAGINSDIKVLAATQNFDNQVGAGATLTTLTGFSWTVVAGATYRFKFRGGTNQGTTGGLKMAFKLTTATLTSIALRAYSSTNTDNTGAVSAAFTTTTDQATWFDQKAVAYTYHEVEGTFVVGTGGTIAVQAAQNTADNEDSTILIGAFAELVRVL